MTDILIADDHSAVRLGLTMLTRKAVGESGDIDFAQSGQEVLQRLQEKNYHMLLSDLVMPDQMGVALIVQALELQPGLRIVIISAAPEQDMAARCIQAGAAAYINKGVADEVFIETIGSVYRGNTLRKCKSAATNEDLKLFDALSPREREVILLLLQGKGVLEIASSLSISASATSTLKGRAFSKLNVQSVIELSRLAYHQGLHSDGESQS